MKLSIDLDESILDDSQLEIITMLKKDFIPKELQYSGAVSGKGAVFKNPHDFWPRLPMGYCWEVEGAGGAQLLAHRDALPIKTEVVLYGPNADEKYNYITFFNGVNVQSFSYTRPASDTYCHGGAKKTKQVNRYPSDLTTDKFRTKSGVQYIRGHCIDYKDTLETYPLSSNDKRNFLPEVDNEIYWNYIRNHWIASVRKNKNAYMQIPYYDEKSNFHFYSNEVPVYTISGAMVPKGVFLSEISTVPVPSFKTSFDISWGLPFSSLINNAGQTYLQSAKKYIHVLNDTIPTSIVRTNFGACCFFNKKRTLSQKISTDTKLPVDLVKSRDDRYKTDILYQMAEEEVLSVSHKINFSLYLSEKLNDGENAKSYLARSKSHAELLLSYDNTDPIVPKHVVDRIGELHKNQALGYEDTEDLDYWTRLAKL